MHALVRSGSIVQYATFAGAAPTLAANKGVWLPVVVSATPSYDADSEVLESPADTVVGSEVIRAQAVTAKSLATVKAERLAAVEAYMVTVFEAGFTVPASFNATSLSPLAGHVLDVASDQNKLDWLTSQAAYSAAVAGGGGAAVEALFRTKANAMVEVTYLQGLYTLLAMAAWGKDVYRNRWDLKDAIAAAADVAAALAIDVTGGW